MAGDKKSRRFTREKLTAPEMDFSAAPKFIRKPLQWIRNYWYYYKMYVVFAVPILLVAVVLIDSAATKKTYDFTVILSGSTTFDSETLDKVCENLSPYLSDVTGDGKLLVGGSDLTIRENLEDEFYANNYNKLAQIMVFDEVVFFLADKYSYAYLEEHGFIEPFSVLGAGSADENALVVNDKGILEGTELEVYGDWYLLVKVQSTAEAGNAAYQARREALREMILALKSV